MENFIQVSSRSLPEKRAKLVIEIHDDDADDHDERDNTDNSDEKEDDYGDEIDDDGENEVDYR